MTKPKQTDNIKKLIDEIEILEAKGLIYCFSRINPSINQNYTYISFKIPTKNDKNA